jgi:hypothetical protein
MQKPKVASKPISDLLAVSFPTAPDDAETTAEIVERTGLSRRSVDKFLFQKFHEGMLKSHAAMRLRRDGIMGRTTVYWIEAK